MTTQSRVLCVPVCLYLLLHLCVCRSVCVHVYHTLVCVCAYIPLCVFITAAVCLWVCLCPCLACICVLTYLCVCISYCICVSVRCLCPCLACTVCVFTGLCVSVSHASVCLHWYAWSRWPHSSHLLLEETVFAVVNNWTVAFHPESSLRANT